MAAPSPRDGAGVVEEATGRAVRGERREPERDGGALLGSAGAPDDLFVDFLVTKHGLGQVLPSGSAGYEALHRHFLERLEPVGAQLLTAAVGSGEVRPGTSAYELLHSIGNLCIARDDDPRYDPRRLIDLLLRGLEELGETRGRSPAAPP